MISPGKQHGLISLTATTAAVALFWLYTILLLVMGASETCAMGGDGHLPTLLVGGPVALTAAVLAYRGGRSGSPHRASRLAMTLPLVILLAYHLPQVYSVTILGHHSCGPSYDYYLEHTQSIERWVPLFFLAIVLVVGWATWRPYLQRNEA